MKKILALLLASLAFGGIAYAASIPSEPAVYDSVLSAPLGSSDTTIYLKSATTNQGSALSGFNCFTIDVNTPNLEYVCGTVSGTTVTGLTRNIDYFTGTTTNSIVATPSHRTGADIRISDFPFLQILHNIFSGSDVFPTSLHYVSGTTFTGSDLYAIPDVAYVNSVGSAGCAFASESTGGCSQLSTAIQAASSTSVGSTGQRLVLPSSLATSSDDIAGLHVVVTQNSGKINWNQIDLANPFTSTATDIFNSGFIVNASSTFTSTINLSGAVNISGTISGIASLSSNFIAGQTLPNGTAVGVLPYQSSPPVFDNSLQGSQSSGANSSFSYTVGSGSNRMLLVAVNTASGATVSGITYNGVSLTQRSTFGTSACANPDGGFYIYYLLAPTSGSNTLVITYSGSTAASYVVYSYANVGQMSPTQVASGNVTGSTGTASVNVTPNLNQSLLWAVSCNENSSLPAPFTNNQKITSGGAAVESAGDAGVIEPFSQQTASTGGSGTYQTVAVVELQAVVASPSISRVYATSASISTSTLSFIGFLAATSTVGASVSVQVQGIVASSTALLSPGQYYLSNTPGMLSASAGSNSRKAAIGIDGTHFLITNIW